MECELLLGAFLNKNNLEIFNKQFEKLLTTSLNNIKLELIKLLNFDKKKSAQLCNERRIIISAFLEKGYYHIYNKGEIDDKILASSFLFKINSIKSQIEEDMKLLLNSNTTPLQTKYNISDIIILRCCNDELKEIAGTYINPNKGNDNIIQQRINSNVSLALISKDNNRRINSNVSLALISKDKQNVHNSFITQRLRNQLIILEKDVIPDDSLENIMPKIKDILNNNISMFSKFRYWILGDNFNDQLFRISTDPTSFFPTNLLLRDIFKRIWYRIIQSPNKNELLFRLKEELIEMKDMCASGYCSRLLNVVSGFPDVDLIEKDIDYTDELFQFLKHILEQEIKRETEEYTDILLDSMIGDKIEYISYINKHKEYFMSLCKQSYKDDEKLQHIYDNVIKRLIN